MRSYTIRFTGRTIGAIGVFHPCEVFVTAEHDAGAVAALYKTHEHIQEPQEVLDGGAVRRMSFTDTTPN